MQTLLVKHVKFSTAFLGYNHLNNRQMMVMLLPKRTLSFSDVS